MNNLSEEIKFKIAQDLIGTTKSLTEVVIDYSLHISSLEEIEQYLDGIGVAECEKCGLWCHVKELSNLLTHSLCHCEECRCYECEDH